MSGSRHPWTDETGGPPLADSDPGRPRAPPVTTAAATAGPQHGTARHGTAGRDKQTSDGQKSVSQTCWPCVPAPASGRRRRHGYQPGPAVTESGQQPPQKTQPATDSV